MQFPTLTKYKAVAFAVPMAVLAAAPAMAVEVMPDLTTMGTTVSTLTGSVTTLVITGATIVTGIIALRFLKVGAGVGFSLLGGLTRSR